MYLYIFILRICARRRRSLNEAFLVNWQIMQFSHVHINTKTLNKLRFITKNNGHNRYCIALNGKLALFFNNL